MKDGQIIAVVGPTAVGKTKRALEIARAEISSGKWTGADLISVDSRQVYRGLEILTGADVPVGFGRVETLNQVQSDAQTDVQCNRVCFANDDESIRIFGISIIEPKDEWSVAHFRKMAQGIIHRSFAEKRMVVLVGGTGLYHRHLFNDDPILSVPPNPQLRYDLESWRVDQLRAKLIELDPSKFINLNQSDRANKRRLIRAMEVSSYRLVGGRSVDSRLGVAKKVSPQSKINFVFLIAPLTEIKTKIKKRVAERFASGAVAEVKQLLALGFPSSAPVLTTHGVPEISKYLQKELTADECQALWAMHEYQYAKRQLTWWKSNGSNFSRDLADSPN